MKRILLVPMLAAWVLFFFCSTISPIEKSAISPPRFFKENFAILFSQGWGFFTKSPRDSSVMPIGGNDEVWAGAVGAPRYAFGLSRAGRAQGPEVAMIASQLEAQQWSKCAERDIEVCARENDTPAKAVSNYANLPSLCGALTMVKWSPLPWEYRRLSDVTRVAEASSKVVVNCVNK